MPESKISIVVVAMNEEGSIGGMLDRVNELPPAYRGEVLLVDGNSKDRTVDIARSKGVQVVFQKEKGRGSAFRTGLENARGDILVYFSPDGNEVPEDIPKLVDKLRQGYDMVIGSRFSMEGGTEDATFLRRIGNNFFTALINLLFGTKTTDAVNGFRAIRRDVMEKLGTDAKRFEIEIEMTMKCAKKGYRIAEVPTFEPKRTCGEGKLSSYVDGSIYLYRILKEFFVR